MYPIKERAKVNIKEDESKCPTEDYVRICLDVYLSLGGIHCCTLKFIVLQITHTRNFALCLKVMYLLFTYSDFFLCLP